MASDVERLARLLCEEWGEDPDERPYVTSANTALHALARWHLMTGRASTLLSLEEPERRALARLRETGETDHG